MSETEGKMKVARLVTFLGTGNYQETVYQFDSKSSRKTRYVGQALAEICEAPQIIVLATEEAETQHRSSLEDCLRDSCLPAPIFVRIPMGRNRDEQWNQFEFLKDQLRGCNGPIMLDITHGFRSQPLFAAAIAAFVRAVDETPPELRICYAAFEARQDNVTPIWEITEFVTLLNWAQALRMFLRTGRALEAAEETTRLGRLLAKAWADGDKRKDERPNLDKLGIALRDFGADLETLRTGDLLIGRGGSRSSASRLLETAKYAKHQVGQHAPPLADILERVVSMAEPLAGAGEDLSGDKGRKTVTALADLYQRLGRNLEAVATVREGWINLYARRTALIPGAGNFDVEERKQAKKRANRDDRTFRDEVTDRRNDFVHAQYRPGGQKAAGIVDTVKDLVEKLRIAKPVEAEATRGTCFVNFSNHSTEKWGNAQIRAACDLAKRIIDIEFPAVPPDADEKTIGILAKEFVARVPPETTHALVQGEFTLTFELVRLLQARGITCLAATTARNVEEEANGRKISSFTFVRFRAYPDLGSA